MKPNYFKHFKSAFGSCYSSPFLNKNHKFMPFILFFMQMKNPFEASLSLVSGK